MRGRERVKGISSDGEKGIRGVCVARQAFACNSDYSTLTSRILFKQFPG